MLLNQTDAASAYTETRTSRLFRSGVTPLHARQVNSSPRRLRKLTRSNLLYHLIRSLMPRSASVIPVRREWNQAHACDPDGSYRSTSRRASASSASSLGIRDRIDLTFLGPYWMIHTSNGFAGILSVSVPANKAWLQSVRRTPAVRFPQHQVPSPPPKEGDRHSPEFPAKNQDGGTMEEFPCICPPSQKKIYATRWNGKESSIGQDQMEQVAAQVPRPRPFGLPAKISLAEYRTGLNPVCPFIAV